jgi:hypothetical protein
VHEARLLEQGRGCSQEGGALIDYKGDYSSFINRNGFFIDKPWFQNSETGIPALRREAINQIRVARAKGLPVIWRVGESQLKAFRDALGNVPGLIIEP